MEVAVESKALKYYLNLQLIKCFIMVPHLSRLVVLLRKTTASHRYCPNLYMDGHIRLKVNDEEHVINVMLSNNDFISRIDL